MASLPVRIATVGCGHGALNEIYENIEKQMQTQGWDSIDCVIIGGDFQTLRNSHDATCMSVKDKWKQIGDFHEYYSGKRVAPFLTIFCGGNHEAGNYLFELYYGGWVAPNIYYMGAANVVNFGPLRIAGLSGIWKGYDYRKPHYERIPYNTEDVQSIYHVREIDVRKLLQLKTQVDVGISHDWPNGIEVFGDSVDLFRRKKHLRDDSQKGALGSKAARQILDYLRPAYWFSAHLHVRFSLTIPHDGVKLVKNTSSPNEPEGWSYAIDERPARSGSPNKRSSPGRSASSVSPGRSRRVHLSEEQVLPWQGSGAHASKSESEQLDRVPTEFGPGQVASGPQDVPSHVNQEEIDLGSDSSSSDLASPPPKRLMMMPAESGPEFENPIVPGHGSGESDLPRRFLPGILARPSAPVQGTTTSTSSITDDLRRKLPGSLSNRPPEIPLRERELKKKAPDAVKNCMTKFLALDKPGGHNPFVELLELSAISKDGTNCQRPFRLQYDKEWLGITKVFAHELQLGDPEATGPTDLGDEGYRRSLESAISWVETNLEQPGLMQIPENFEPVAPAYDPEVPITTTEGPLEYPNPQTAAFCQLLDIENKFALTAEEQEARMLAGARPNVRPNAGFGTRRGTRGGKYRKRGRQVVGN